MTTSAEEKNFREDLIEFCTGGFAGTIPLLREFHYDKTGIVLEGLHFSAASLLLHMSHRQHIFLRFMQEPENIADLWPKAYWPKEKALGKEAWETAMEKFENDLSQIIEIVKNPKTDLFEQQKNGKSLFWAAVTNFQHNAYHIGQLKSIGRQLGVW